jgi:integrase
VLHEASRGALAAQVQTGVTFADAAAEWLRYVEVDRERKPSTVAGYKVIVRSQLLPAFGETPVEAITTSMIERWLASLSGAASSRTKALVLLHGILKRAKKVWGLQSNPAAEVERPPVRRSGEIQVFSPEEVWALVRAAASEQDAAIYLTAAFTGLRLGELLALSWRDVDFPGSVIRVRASARRIAPRRRSLEDRPARTPRALEASPGASRRAGPRARFDLYGIEQDIDTTAKGCNSAHQPVIEALELIRRFTGAGNITY